MSRTNLFLDGIVHFRWTVPFTLVEGGTLNGEKSCGRSERLCLIITTKGKRSSERERRVVDWNHLFCEDINIVVILLDDLVQKSKKLFRYFNIMASKIDKWVKAGYQLLATDEIDGINIERLARTVNANKSGFYHYFGTKEEYFKNLVSHHIQRAQMVAAQIQHCDTVDPDLLRVIVKEKIFFLVEAQLLVKGKPLKTKVDTNEAGRIIADEVVALWRKHNDPLTDMKSALANVDSIRHFFYARINPRNISYKYLHGLIDEI